MKTLFVLLIGAALGIAGYMHFVSPGGRGHGERNVGEKFNQSFTNLDTSEIQREVERTGQVIRKKAERAGEVIKDAAADTRITTEIKGRYALDSKLSALRISVSTTDGIVTISGSAASAEDIQRAMRIALETEGVREVVSTIQVKRQKDP